ncbi:MAG: hypothetical protein LBH39_02625 [Clostridiales Family XIII bacterium]|nr:hypothetical protein [Clostridiales Family XIII bacterium]
MKAAAAAVFCLSFAVCIATLSGVFGAPVLHAAPQASVTMLDSAAVGGYVLVGVVCFVMGAAAMLYCRRGAKRKT